MLNLERQGKVQVAELSFSFESVVDYVTRVVDVFYAVSVKRSNRLTDREVQFFVATVINYNLGHKYTERDSDYVYEAVFGKHRKSDRKDYIKRLEKKEWLKTSGGDLILPEIFKKINLQEDRTVFNIDIRIEKKEDEVLN